MRKIKAIILRNELKEDHLLWIRACEDYKDKVEYRVVNLTSDHWFEETTRDEFDVLLAKPGGLTAPLKQLYDERIYILGKVLGYKIFPSPDEIFIYENKRFLSFWLKANCIPHPITHVFYDKEEATEFIRKSEFPIVAKTSIGASGSGIKILNSRKEAYKYVDKTFSDRGAPKRTGPNFSTGGWIKRGLNYVLKPTRIKEKLKIYQADKSDIQTGFIIIQEYIRHDFEWRVVRIGDSFFAHKKLKKGDKASGSLLKSYETPPFSLFDFVKNITDKYNLNSQAVDVFETPSGYMVNEMQCMFGQSDPYQMLIGANPGRYRYLENRWIFEKGDFNKNESFNLRVEYILQNFL